MKVFLFSPAFKVEFFIGTSKMFLGVEYVGKFALGKEDIILDVVGSFF